MAMALLNLTKLGGMSMGWASGVVKPVVGNLGEDKWK